MSIQNVSNLSANLGTTEPEAVAESDTQPTTNAHSNPPVVAASLSQDGVQEPPATHNLGAVPMATAEAPKLPNAAGETAPPSTARHYVDNAANLSDHAAFTIIQQMQMKSLTVAANLRRAAQQSVINESLNAAHDLMRQVAGERAGAVYKLLGDIGAGVISFGAGLKGSSLRNSGDDSMRALGGGVDAAAQQMGNLFSSSVTMFDKVSGNGTHQADQARMDQKYDEVRRSMAQQTLDNARGLYDQADKTLQNAVQSFSDYFKRKEGLMNNIANQ